MTIRIDRILLAGSLGACVLLAACSPTVVRLSDARATRTTYEISCDHGGHDLLGCHREAARLCPRGYDQVTTADDVAWSRRGELLFDRFFVGKPARRVITVTCE